MYDVSFLLRGKLKAEILKYLDKPHTATELSKKFKKHRASMSRVLIDLESHGLAVCLNPKDNMHRFYQITDRGKQALERLKEFGSN